MNGHYVSQPEATSVAISRAQDALVKALEASVLLSAYHMDDGEINRIVSALKAMIRKLEKLDGEIK